MIETEQILVLFFEQHFRELGKFQDSESIMELYQKLEKEKEKLEEISKETKSRNSRPVAKRSRI